jgi:uncharacterized oligopeptide transporter (OPT) family protein
VSRRPAAYHVAYTFRGGYAFNAFLLALQQTNSSDSTGERALLLLAKGRREIFRNRAIASVNKRLCSAGETSISAWFALHLLVQIFTMSPTAQRPEAAASPSFTESGLTLRALVFGSTFGVLLCIANTLFGLQSGWVTMASVQSAVLSFGAYKLQTKLWPDTRPFTVAENVVAQTISVASATMPLAAGFVGIIPALRIIERRGDLGDTKAPLETPGSQIIWSLCLAFLGVFVAVPLRGLVTKLVFPSGTATALAIKTIHAQDESSFSAANPRSPPPESSASSFFPHNSLPLQPGLSSRSRVIADDGSREDKNLLSSASATAPYDDGGLVTAAPTEDSSSFAPMAEQNPLAAPSAPSSSTALEIESTSDASTAGQLRATTSTPIGEPEGGAAMADAGQLAGHDLRLSGGTSLAKSFRLALYAFIASGLLTIATFFFPVLSAISIAAPLASWGWVINLSLAYAAQGIIMGLSTTLSMLFGAVLGWGMIGPWMQSVGAITKPLSSSASGGGRGFLTWIALSMMIAEAAAGALVTISNMIKDSCNKETAKKDSPAGTLGAGSSKGPEQIIPGWAWMSGLGGCSLVAVIALIPLAGVSFWQSLLAIILSLPISVVAARALGETDLNPVSGLGKLSQLAFGITFPGAGAVANIVAGAVAEAGAQQAGDLLQDLKTGYLLGVPLRAQFYGQLIGSLLSVFAATAAFWVFDSAYGIPSPSLPAPTAAVWVAMADLMSGTGKASIPSQVIPFVVIAGILSFVLTLLLVVADAAKESGRPLASFPNWVRLLVRISPYCPSPTAAAIGLYIAPSWTLPRVAGAVVGAVLSSRYGMPRQLLIMMATGFVLGEGLLALFNAGLAAMGVRPLSCGGCIAGSCGNFCP